MRLRRRFKANKQKLEIIAAVDIDHCAGNCKLCRVLTIETEVAKEMLQSGNYDFKAFLAECKRRWFDQAG